VLVPATTGRETRRAALGAAVLLGALSGALPTAWASEAATVEGTSAVTSATWGAAPTSAGTGSAPACVTFPAECGPFSASSPTGLSVVYFDVWNTGSLSLSGVSFSVSVTTGRFSLYACSVPWNANGTCAGTTTKLVHNVASGTYPVTAAVPVSPGAVEYLRLVPSKAPTSVTVATSVCSGGAGCTDATTTRQVQPAVVVDQ
jgi:hypothetical protein